MLDVSCSLCYHVHTNMSCKTRKGYPIYPLLWLQWVRQYPLETALFLLSVIMIPCFIEKCNSDCVSFLQSPIFARISVFRCQGYVIIPNHAQKRSYPQIMAVWDKESWINDVCLSSKCSVCRFKALCGIEVCKPKDAQKRSKRLSDAFTSISEHYTLCYCVSYCIDALRHP